jgi:hypothetical protein
VVDRSLTLRVPWIRQGEATETPAWDYRFAVPECGEMELSIEAPTDCRLSVDRGVVVAVDKSPSARRTWRFALGGNRGFGLHARRRRELTDTVAPAVRQRSTYDLSAAGIQLLTEFELDVYDEPVEFAEVVVSRDLRGVSIEVEGEAVDWRPLEARDEASASTRLRVDFPDQIVGKGHRLIVRAFAAGSPDGERQLPSVQLAGTFWQQGVTLVRVASPLEIVALDLSDCLQTDARQVSDPFMGELIELRLFDPAASVSLAIRQRPVRLEVERVDELTLAADAVAMRIASRLSTEQGSRFRLEADVDADCVIEAVHSKPADALVDWFVEPDGDASRLIVRLAGAVSPDRSVELVVEARSLVSPLGRALGRDALVQLDWRDAVVTGHFLSLRFEEGFEATPADPEQLPRVDASSLSAPRLALFSSSNPEMVIDVSRPAEPWALSLSEEHAQYEAAIEVTAAVDGDQVTEKYVIRVEPIGSRVDRLYVHFSSVSSEAIEWSVRPDLGGQLAARRLTPAQQAAIGLSPAGETWDIRLSRHRIAPFQLATERSATRGESWDVGLAMVQGATRQSGALTVEAAPATGVRIVADRLRALPGSDDDFDRPSRVRGEYQYLPARDARGEGEAAVVLQRDADFARHSSLVVWDCAYSSWIDPTGVALHRVLYQVENFGADRFTVRLDEADRLRRAEVNHRVTLPQSLGNVHTVVLPGDARFTVVAFELESRQTRLGWLGRVELPRIECDVDVLSQRRVVWLPADYEVVDERMTATGALSGAGWRSRLFGPLADSASRFARGRPLAIAGITGDGVTGVPRIDDWIEALGRAHRGLVADGAVETTWGELFTGASQRHYASPTNRLLVDPAALDAVGLRPGVLVLPVAEGTDLTVGAELLMSANLVIVREAGWNVLTTTVSLNRRADGGSVGVGVVGGEMGDELSAGQILSATHAPWHLVGLEASCSQPQPPWQTSAEATATAETGHQWNALTVSGSDAGMSLLVVDRRAWTACAGATFLFTVALGWAVRWVGKVWVVVAGLLAASAALVVPPLYVPFCTAVFGGCAAALVGRALSTLRLKLKKPEFATPKGDVRTLGAVVSMLLVVFLFVLSLTGGVAGQENQADRAMAAQQVHRVFIPLGDDRLPSAARYYVPPKLYDELRRRAAEARLEPSGWMIERAEYQGALDPDESVGQLRLNSLKASYYLNVFGPDAEVVFPLPSALASVRVADVAVDGLVVTRRDEKDRAVFVVDALGQHVVDVTFAVSDDPRARSDQFQIEIPTVARSTLVMRVPPGPERVRVASTTGSVTHDQARGRLEASLAESGRLDVRWGNRSIAEAEMSVAEFLWLDVRPGGVEIAAMYEPIGGIAGEGELHIACEPRLRPLPRVDEGAQPDMAVQNGSATHVVALGESSARQGAYFALFRQLDAAGIGRLRVPRVGPLWADVETRLVAVSVDPALQMAAADGLEMVEVDEFLSHWGETNRRPDFVCRRPTDGRAVLATRLPQPRRIVSENAVYRVDLEQLFVELRSRIETVEGNPFQHRVHLPDHFFVEDVTLIGESERDERLVRHWCQDDDGNLVVQVAAGAPARFELRVRGELPIRAGEEFHLPDVGLEGADQLQRTVELYRSRRVRVELTGEEPDATAGDRFMASAETPRWFGVARFTSPAGDSDVTVRVLENDPVVVAVQRTVLERKAGDWHVRIEGDLDVEGGILDEAHIRLPRSVVGPFETTDDVALRLRATDRTETNMLSVRPRQSVSGRWRFAISSPLVFESGQPVELLPIDLLGADPLRQTILLPSRSAPDEISWDPVGLAREVGPRINERSGGSSIYDVYRVTTPLYSAKMRSQRRAQPHPRVQFAQASVSWSADDDCRGLATFDVDPGDLRHCAMQMPMGWRIDRITIDGVPATWYATGEGRFRIELAQGIAPLRIAVFYQREATTQETRHDEVAAPTFLDLPMPETLWSISAAGPVDVSADRSDADQDIALTPLDVAIRRYQGLVRVVARFVDSSRQRPREEVDAAARSWLGRVATARADVARRRSDEFDIVRRSAADESIRRVDSIWQAVTARLATDETAPAGPPEGNRASGDVVSLWQATVSDRQFDAYVATPPTVDRLEVTSVGESTGLWGRAIAAIACAGLAIVMVRQRRWLGRVDLSIGWLYAIGLAVGTIWWMTLVPSVVGLAILAWSALSLLFWWRGTSTPEAQKPAVLATGDSQPA